MARGRMAWDLVIKAQVLYKRRVKIKAQPPPPKAAVRYMRTPSAISAPVL